MKKLFVGVLMVVMMVGFGGCAGMQPIPENEKNHPIAENFKSFKAVVEYENKDTDTIPWLSWFNSNIQYCQGLPVASCCLLIATGSYFLLF